MEILAGERKIESRSSLILTNLRLVQESDSLMKKIHKEIPLNKIDSIRYEYRRNLGMLLLGSLLVMVGLVFGEISEEWFLLAIIGAVIFVIALLWKGEFIEFSSTSMSILEKGRGMDEFAQSVREEMYLQQYLRK